ncbi:FK506-binding protein 15 [Xylocopa sonorina]|uniref:FK506-binding protein 15 n=1 Tax=Xylocopa sonorina TaxID=1818115 RepID=UPI00403A9DFD
MNVGSQALNLDKILRDDDESDFLPASGSNLAAIFGLQTKTLDSCSSAKQASKKLNTTRTLTQTISNKTEVLIAKVIYAFKLQNGSYISIGKLGMALTGNHATKLYQIILYKNKQEHLSIVTVTDHFVYTIQSNDYSSYYDNNKENWSILFENNDVCVEFAKEVGLARYFSKNGKIENVLYQDLSPPSYDTTAKEGDHVSIKYFIATEIIQPFKNALTTYQTMTVEISTDDNWEKTLLGCSKGLRKILFLPPNKQISLGPGFPKEKDVLLEIEIIDIQTPDETAVSKIPSGKASIISRMAKMGQSILPKLPMSTTTDSEDTEDDMSHKSTHSRKVESSEDDSRKRYPSKELKDEVSKSSHRLLKPKSDVPVTNVACKPFVNSQWSPTQIQPNFVTLDGQIYSLPSQAVTPTIPAIMDPGLNMLLSETRMTNAELRMGMSKIADNVQKLLDKFHVIELQNAATPIQDRTALDAALKMLLTMNASEEKAEQSHRTSNIAADNFTQLNEMKDRVAILEKELKQSKERMKELEIEKESLTQTNEMLHKTVKQLEISLKDSNTAFVNTRRNLEEAKELNSIYEEQTIMLENKMLKLSDGCSSTDIKKNDNIKEIKYIMNRIYHNLLDKFVDESYSKNSIRTIIANTIKNVTLQVLYHTNENNDVESEQSSSNITDTDSLQIDNNRKKQISDLNHSEITKVSSILQTEPPPIPPIDTEDDND